MTRRTFALPVIFTDFLFLALLAMLLLINPPTEADTATPPGNMSVTIVWPEGSDDVDLWLIGPGQAKPVGYSNRGGSLWNLLRDDLGTSSDPMPLNMEHAYSRGLPAGEYIINLHGFRLPNSPVTVAVEVRKGEFGRRQALLFQETVVLRAAQEKTVVRFKLDGDGDVIPGSVDHVFRPLRSRR
ncbi:hypothetical protein [Chelativorans xinjiangense]|uniref:hypothetical protein n=1 Tax=Chelativorans xinjiangense TaxID=2681485 RepID=UPI001359CEA4|nr:hypothetical protein [Chelativorans xinjiangense]